MAQMQTHAAGGGKGKPDETPGGGSGGTGSPTWSTVTAATASLFNWFDTDAA